MSKTIAIATDHAGVELKEELKKVIAIMGFEIMDLGTDSTKSVDYPDYADKLCHEIIEGKADAGILICGSGVGMSIAANRYKEIRAALCHDEKSARLARQHNDANVLVLGSRVISNDEATSCVKTFFTTDFDGGRHQGRVDKL